MAKDFSSFVSNKSQQDQDRKQQQQADFSQIKDKYNINDSDIDAVQRVAEKYSGASEDTMLNDIIQGFRQQKAAGTMTNDDILSFARRAAPMLNEQQRSRLKKVIDKLVSEN